MKPDRKRPWILKILLDFLTADYLSWKIVGHSVFFRRKSGHRREKPLHIAFKKEDGTIPDQERRMDGV